MSWQKVNYRIAQKDGTEHFYNGWRCGYFAHNFGCDLTHLASGFKVGSFSREDDCRRVGEYLNRHFADELAAVKSVIGRKKLTFEQIGALPEMMDFLHKCKADAEFMKLMGDLAIKAGETNEPAG